MPQRPHTRPCPRRRSTNSCLRCSYRVLKTSSTGGTHLHVLQGSVLTLINNKKMVIFVFFFMNFFVCRGRGRPSLGTNINIKPQSSLIRPPGMVFKQQTVSGGGSVLVPTSYQLSGNQVFQVGGRFFKLFF